MQQADSTVKVRDNRRGINRLRGQASNPDLLVQGQAWCQFHHLASVWTEGLEPPTPGFRRRCPPYPHHRPPAYSRHELGHVQVVLTVGFEPTLTAV